jgi:hypothetical protein
MVLRQFPPDRDPVAAIRTRWPPLLYATCPDPAPPPRAMHALRTAFHAAYVNLPPETWYLPPLAQSDAVLRAVAAFCASVPIPSPLLDYFSRDLETHELEFKVFTAFADLARHPDQLEAFIARTHDDFREDFPAQRLDPEQRCGRHPYCREVCDAGA